MKDIQHVLYINLDKRVDRKRHVIVELASIDIFNPQRFAAVRNTRNPALGCSMSHLQCLMHAKENNWPHVMIVEDDILFLNKQLFQTQLDLFFREADLEWDVVLLAGNNMSHVKPIYMHSVRVTHCQTTTGYIVRQSYYDTLIHNIRTGIDLFRRYPQLRNNYAIDQFWFYLQQRDRWYLILPLSVVQLDGYSDIERKQVKYREIMLRLN